MKKTIHKETSFKEPVTFSAKEREALKIICEYAARRCGGGEDIIGAILYTGGFHYLDDHDSAVVDLAKKIEGR